MVAESEHIAKPNSKKMIGLIAKLKRIFSGFSSLYSFSSLTRRIVFLNIAALIILVIGVLYLNKFRAGLIDSRIQSLLTQGEIIAGAVAAAATINTDAIIVDPDRLLQLQAGETISPAEEELKSLEFPLNPERAAPILRRLISPTRTRARIFDREGVLIVDSRNLFRRGQILSFDLPPPELKSEFSIVKLWNQFGRWVFSSDLPLQQELAGENGKGYPEVVAALSGASVSVVRVNQKGELIVSVAVPVQRFRAVLGAMVLSTQGGDIDTIVRAERWGILRLFLVAAGVTGLLSFLLAGTIAGPMRKLASAAERVRRGTQARFEIPDFTKRGDEIGHLSGALRDMTTALYNRIDAIESFAADVAHELKNPLTSLRSAVETLPLAKTKASRDRLFSVIQDDVSRLDRLISDISDASRLDAELAREEAIPVDVADMLKTVVLIVNELREEDEAPINLTIQAQGSGNDNYFVLGHDSRLGQVIRNLLDNARSFSLKGAPVKIYARRLPKEIEIKIEDEGPGIRPDNLEKIFARFYTDRPGEDNFGKNSGLGLSISKQIIEAHGGRIWAENRVKGRANSSTKPSEKDILGARFILRLPVMTQKSAPKTKHPKRAI
jgi:two-component system sensor histidine kinase ChvG